MDILTYVNRAQAAMDDGEFDLAERYYNQILAQFPHNPEALHGLKELEVARARKQWNIVYWAYKVLRGQVLILLGKADQAFAGIELAHRVRPKNTWGSMVYAACAEKLGKFEEAHQAYDDLLSFHSTHQKALEKDANVLMYLDRLEEAEKRLHHLLKLRPKDDQIAHRLRDISAKSYARTGIPEDLKARRREMEKEKQQMQGTPEFVEKLEEMKQAYEADPANLEVGVALAAHYRQGELYDQANQILGKILDSEPDCIPAKREQARVWRKTGDWQIASQLYEELLQEAPADRLLKDEYYDTVIAFKTRKIEQGEKSKDDWNEVEKLKLDKEKNRIEYLRGYLNSHPESFDERVEIGRLLIKHGQIDEAITYLQRLVHELPYAAKGFFLLGQCFRAKGDHALAVSQYEKSIEYFKNRGYSHIPSAELKECYYYMGLSKEALGDMPGAREAFGQIYSADIHYKDVRERYEKTFK
ncbi:tetratricopeptide repeat protein [bacterium]|nr:tetratricopeptide repeat protein [bacterium]